MATKNQNPDTVEKVADSPETAGPAAKRVKRIPVDRLRRSCVKLFGISPSTFDGATVGIDPNGKYSVEEMQNIIDNWLKREVK